jgi:FKBP-type peptidyl-prolyl cis-trans isomerase SlyD
MMKIEKGKRVKMEYELLLMNGELIESSSKRGPIEYIHGEGMMLPGLEKQIEGLGPQQKKEGIIKAEEAYGTAQTLPHIQLSPKDFPSGEPIEIGKCFEAKDKDGHTVQFTVVAVGDGRITARLDHPLAGKDIRYRVKILEVNDAN